MTEAIWLALGAALGAPLRFVADLLVQSRRDSRFPWGTFGVNVVGSLALGAAAGGLAASGDQTWLRYGVGLGFCGALTTFSAFAYETVRLCADGEIRAATWNVVASTTVAVAAAALGYAVVAAILC